MFTQTKFVGHDVKAIEKFYKQQLKAAKKFAKSDEEAAEIAWSMVEYYKHQFRVFA